ncbi:MULTISPECIES: DHH family phosphoesterase [unclassified Methanoregula]|uniref:single-stranded-DNA-specific exonuclease RecJ n=1 Tax=unclassified Methanoregula TaxID=2649730 RepID=UPI0009D2FBF3|nr:MULTISPECIES: DHH family phosphoesterase [unclassified Methanoregula]OPX65535.1 MAG: DHHA1 domain protein [Methanoregula sp. PtaB.Bin085]OPY35815.1 MAG: DHHA1 domain protein [Methanoregula sp. PtaU1.Bin006]
MGFCDDVKAAAEQIAAAQEVTIISHIDADGIACEAILSQAVSRLEIPVKSVFVRQLEPLTMPQVPADSSLKVFADLGAGQQNLMRDRGFTDKEILIIDHHVSQPVEGCQYTQVNCLPYGFTRMSAAGVSYLVSKELDSANTDLAMLAVIGNVGDMMAREKCGLVGPARDIIVEDGARHGSVEVRKKDLNCYGTSTRPLHLSLAYNDDPFIKGITNNPEGARQFLKRLGIRQQAPDGRWYVWEEIPVEDKRTVISALAEQLMANGEKLDRLLAETYGFPLETPRTPLRNAQEYATVLNACGRWSKPQVGGAILRGDRGQAYRDAEHMLTNHRSIIRDLLQFIIDTGVKELENLQWLHVGGRYPDTIVGIGAGMALSKLNSSKPILIMCEVPEDRNLTKVSMRTNERVVEKGIDLQQALASASAEYGGGGGGHKIAAGAYIPKTAEQEFVERVNRILGEQFAAACPGHR